MNILSRRHNRILVVRPDRIGDVVLSTPVFHTLKESFPDSFIGALVSPYTSSLLTGNPYLNVIITDDPLKENFRTKIKEIREFRFDTALLLLPTKRLAYLLFFAGIPYRVGVGHILYEVITFMHGVSRKKYNPLRHELDYMLDLPKKIGAEKIWRKPEIFLNAEEKESARKFLEQRGFNTERPIVGIHPGSGHSSPNWQIERYSELANMLARSSVQTLVTGASHEKNQEDLLLKMVDRSVKTTYGELSLRELASVISQLSLLFSSSTGPMHVAAAVNTPTVSMFCPLTACSPKLWGPVGNVSKIILPPDDFCQSKCPGDPHVCTFGNGTDGIAVRKVYDAIIQSLNETDKILAGGISENFDLRGMKKELR